MTQVPASKAGVLLNMEPLIGSLLGVFALGERLGPMAWVGGTMILGAALTLDDARRVAARVGAGGPGLGGNRGGNWLRGLKQKRLTDAVPAIEQDGSGEDERNGESGPEADGSPAKMESEVDAHGQADQPVGAAMGDEAGVGVACATESADGGDLKDRRRSGRRRRRRRGERQRR